MTSLDNPRPALQLVRQGHLVSLHKHRSADEAGFVRWYTDDEIARLLRHDLQALTPSQAHGYFTTVIMPSSAFGTAWAIRENTTDRLLGTTAISEMDEVPNECLFRIVIGEKDAWGQGYGTDATRLVVAEAFERFKLNAVNLEVFAHNPRAQRSYARVGFRETGRVEEWARNTWLDVIRMRLSRSEWDGTYANDPYTS